jgi:predicted DNA-binding transcriptional regulator AlpA
MTNTETLDRLHRTREVAKLQGISTRTLYEYVKAGRFPPPDVPAERHGAPAFWYSSTIRRARVEQRERAKQVNEVAA